MYENTTRKLSTARKTKNHQKTNFCRKSTNFKLYLDINLFSQFFYVTEGKNTPISFSSFSPGPDMLPGEQACASMLTPVDHFWDDLGCSGGSGADREALCMKIG